VFWNKDPDWTWTRIHNWEKEQRETWKKEDSLNWQLGYYVSKAISACLSEDAEYPEEPIFYQPTREEKIAKLESEIDKAFGIT
jgi:hypothetical protein